MLVAAMLLLMFRHLMLPLRCRFYCCRRHMITPYAAAPRCCLLDDAAIRLFSFAPPFFHDAMFSLLMPCRYAEDDSDITNRDLNANTPTEEYTDKYTIFLHFLSFLFSSSSSAAFFFFSSLHTVMAIFFLFITPTIITPSSFHATVTSFSSAHPYFH